MGKTKDPFKKIRDTKGTFQAEFGTIKNTLVINRINREPIPHSCLAPELMVYT